MLPLRALITGGIVTHEPDEDLVLFFFKQKDIEE